jgi:hypothetical protein
LPKPAAEAVADDPVVSQLALEASRSLLKTHGAAAISRRYSKFAAFHFRARKPWSEKLRYARYLLLDTTDQDWRHFPLPAGLSWLHPLLRPLRLSMKFLALALPGGGGDLAQGSKFKAKGIVAEYTPRLHKQYGEIS